MAGPWDFLKHNKQDTVSQADRSAFQDYNTHPQEKKPLILEGKIEETGVATPQYAPVPRAPMLAPVAAPVQRGYINQPNVRGDAQQTKLPAGIEEFRERDGYNINAYVDKYRQIPLIAGFKKQYINYNPVAISEDSDLNDLMGAVESFGLMRGMRLPRTQITVLHEFDLIVPANIPDGMKCFFHYKRVEGDDWRYKDPEVDTTTTEGEVYTDYTIDGKPRRYFVGVASFSLIDGTQTHKRAVMIPLGRYYNNRHAEIEAFKRHFANQNAPGDDERARLPQLETLPRHLQQVIRTYPGLLFGR